MFLCGLDIGKKSDPSAFCVIEEKDVDPTQEQLENGTEDLRAFGVRFLGRPPLGTAYTDVIRWVLGFMRRPQLDGNAVLIVDATGVGEPIVDFIRETIDAPIVGITITGGQVPKETEYGFNVPKRDLVAAVSVLLETERLKISKHLDLHQVLVTELLNFQYKISKTSLHDSYGAWREGEHDDLVLAVACAVWYGLNHGPMHGGWARVGGGNLNTPPKPKREIPKEERAAMIEAAYNGIISDLLSDDDDDF